MALIYSVGVDDLLLQSQNTNKTHIIPDQFLFGSSSGGQSHSLTSDPKPVIQSESGIEISV
jgi:hypothetical protein